MTDVCRGVGRVGKGASLRNDKQKGKDKDNCNGNDGSGFLPLRLRSAWGMTNKNHEMVVVCGVERVRKGNGIRVGRRVFIPTLSHVVAKDGHPALLFLEILRNSNGKASVSSIRGSSHASHEPLCSLHSYAVCHRSHRFPVRARRELASVHVRLRPSSGEINPELGDCEGAGPIRKATYRCPVTTAADALLMNGE